MKYLTGRLLGRRRKTRRRVRCPGERGICDRKRFSKLKNSEANKPKKSVSVSKAMLGRLSSQTPNCREDLTNPSDVCGGRGRSDSSKSAETH